MKNKLIVVIIIQALTNVILFGLLAACHNRKAHKSWIELNYPTNTQWQATLPE